VSDETGLDRDYHLDPYATYTRSPQTWFAVGGVRPDLKPKTLVLGIASGSHAKAYPFAELAKAASVRDVIGGRAVRIEVTAQGDLVSIIVEDGAPLTHTVAYWLAGQAFYPRAGLYP
jgi:hypothetical protein